MLDDECDQARDACTGGGRAGERVGRGVCDAVARYRIQLSGRLGVTSMNLCCRLPPASLDALLHTLSCRYLPMCALLIVGCRSCEQTNHLHVPVRTVSGITLWWLC
jgi:hypothetical protein